VVYAFDGADPVKQDRAIEILGSGDRLVLSTQVLLESLVGSYPKRLAEPLEEDLASEIIDRLGDLPVVSTDPQLVRQAIETARRFGIAIWDALIIEAARSAGCSSILSEDLQSSQDFGGVRVLNPFS
jgi:predicted nucleic acid-binding protein